MLKPAIFKKLFDTFHSDSVSKAKLKQRASELKVHPDQTVNCIDIYISGMLTAGLVQVEGDQVRHVASSEVGSPGGASATVEEHSDETGAESVSEERAAADRNASGDGSPIGASDVRQDPEALPEAPGKPGPRAVFNVNVTLDSSLDTDKLQKQLELLKRFGAI